MLLLGPLVNLLGLFLLFLIHYSYFLKFVVKHLDEYDLFLLQKNRIDFAPSVDFV
jgi:hypothetical protein